MILTGAAVIIAGQSAGQGYVEVYQDPMVDVVLRQYDSVQNIRLQNPVHKGIEGYRIQVFFDSGNNSGDRAQKVRAEFEISYPDIFAYVTWDAPYYKVRAGDFRTRLEAEKRMPEILAKYPDSFVVKDKINFPAVN